MIIKNRIFKTAFFSIVFLLTSSLAHSKYSKPEIEIDFKADKILVEKEKRKLSLLKDGKVLKTYKIAIGSNSTGPKSKQGDGRTPEGNYFVQGRNPQSKYHLALRVSYPNSADRARARALKASPGGDIMIHGLPNGSEWMEQVMYTPAFWTRGCIALSNRDMDEVWKAVPNGAAIQIVP